LRVRVAVSITTRACMRVAASDAENPNDLRKRGRRKHDEAIVGDFRDGSKHRGHCTIAADAYLSNPIWIIVLASPGRGSDMSAPLVSKMVSLSINQRLILDNRPRAAGIIAAELVARYSPRP
jgi:hypothetical protein